MVDLSLLQDFIAETAEYLEEMEDILLRLEADPGNKTMLDDVFRSVHTIKGAAEYLGIERISELSKTIENMLYNLLRQSNIMVSQEVIDLLLDTQKRIALLTDNLHQTQTEQAEIDDLIERVQTANTAAEISEKANHEPEDTEDSTQSDNHTTEAEEFEINEEDENDEELFTIFLEQMEEKLSELQDQISNLYTTDSDTQADILDICLNQIIDPLSSSANYMGYEQLVTYYDDWSQELLATKALLNDNSKDFDPDSIRESLNSKIEELVKRYPRLQLTKPLESRLTTKNCDADESENSPDNQTDDILEEYADTTSSSPSELHTTTDNQDKGDADLFAQLSWSFDNRIKQTAAETDQVEIESELFSDPETISAPETLSTRKDINQVATDTDDLPTYIDDYEEENDEELFLIFKEQLENKLANLQIQTAALQATREDEDLINILDICLEQLNRLCSSANYMGYEQLTLFFEKWETEVTDIRTHVQNHDSSSFPAFINDCMKANIAEAYNRFPHLSPKEKIPLETSLTQETTVKSAPEPKQTPEEKLQTAENNADIEPQLTTDLSMLPDFIIETREHLELMEENILTLDSTSDEQEILNDIFRSIHTIKGAAEYLGIQRIAKLTHNLENLLYQLRQQKLNVNRDVIDLLMAGWDRISLLTDNLEQTHAEQAEIADLLERIRNLDSNNKISDITEIAYATTAELEIEATRKTETELVAEALKDEHEALLKGTDRRQNPEQSMRRQSDQINEKTLKQSIRVDASKIDALMNQVGELVVSRAGFTQLLGEMQDLQQELKQNFKIDIREMRQLSSMTFRLSEATALFGKVTNELQEEVMKVRMLPISQLFNRYPRLVFDLVHDTGKKVQLDIHGEDTELDKMVIEEISDPLIHIIRNAVDHGIESPAERLRKGKPETGTIRLKAYHEGNHVVIEIMDDGRGLDLDRIKEKAVAEKFVSRSELEHMSTQEITGLIMKPGFSTKEAVTHLSGRGVGMDVVRKNIEKLNGTIEIDTTTGVSMYFRIKIPLTLAIIPALRIRVSSELFTIPLSTVEETLRISPADISTIEGAEVMSFRGMTLPLVRMDELFNLEKVTTNQPLEFVVVVSTGMKHVGLIVDDLLGQEEVVIKPLEDYIQEKSGFSGATILGDGRISLILDVYELINLPVNRNKR